MELIPVFGTSFTVYMPIVIIIVAILAFFNGYSRLISIFGVQTVESSSLDSIDCSCMCGSTGHEVIESKVDLEAVPTTPQKSSKPLPFDFSRNRLSTAEQDRIMSGRSLVMAEIRRMEGSQTTPKSRSDSNSKQSLRQTTNEKSPGILPIPGMSAITVTSSRSSALRPLSYFSDDPKGKYDKTVSVNDDLEEEEIELYGDVSRPTSRAGVTQLYKSRYSDNPTTSTAYNPLNSARINSSGDSSGRSNQQTSLPVKDAFTISDDNYYRGRYDDR